MSDNKNMADHIRWNYPTILKLARNSGLGGERYAIMLSKMQSIANELLDIEQDLAIQEANSTALEQELFTPLTIHPLAIGIVIGHTAKAKGAYSEPLDVSEYDFWRMAVDEITLPLLNQHGIATIVVDRNGGTAAAYANLDEQDLAYTVELHFNGSYDPAHRGFETLALRDSPRAREVAREFNSVFDMQSLIPMRRSDNDGVKDIYASTDPNTSRGMYSLRQSKYPSIITEPFFGSNQSDCENFNIEHFVEALAAAHKAITD